MTPVILKVFSGKPSEGVSMKPVKLYSIYIQESPARGSCKVDKTFVLFRMRKICPFKGQNMSVSNYFIFAEKWKWKIDYGIPTIFKYSIKHAENMFECFWKHANHQNVLQSTQSEFLNFASKQTRGKHVIFTTR